MIDISSWFCAPFIPFYMPGIMVFIMIFMRVFNSKRTWAWATQTVHQASSQPMSTIHNLSSHNTLHPHSTHLSYCPSSRNPSTLWFTTLISVLPFLTVSMTSFWFQFRESAIFLGAKWWNFKSRNEPKKKRHEKLKTPHRLTHRL